MLEALGNLRVSGEPEVAVAVRRSPRARRMYLRVSRVDGRATLSLPPGTGLREAADFLDQNTDWLRRHLAARSPAEVPEVGGSLTVAGRRLPILAGAGRLPRLTGEAVLVDIRRPVGPQAAALLKTLARERLAAACDVHAARLGCSYRALRLRDTRSRWGSCTAQGDLMFSWRLAMAPETVQDYVAAHEVAHLRVMNHSPAFWDLVVELRPDWRQQRAWLRDATAALHAVRFAG